MINGFENEDIIAILDEHLKVYFEKLEKAISSSNKIENEASCSQ